MNSNNYRIDHPVVRVQLVVGVVVELDARCDHVQVPGTAVIGLQALAQLAESRIERKLAEENLWRSSDEITECS